MTLTSPLHWPMRRPRTSPAKRRSNSAFKRSINMAIEDIKTEVRRLHGTDLVVSTNLELRIDGFPRSDRRAPDDPAAAVYFTRNGSDLVFACDTWGSVAQNLQAIAMHLNAMRGQERWGVGTLDQAFAGYQALAEDAASPPWWKSLGCEESPRTLDELRAAYHAQARRAHPDAGGSQEEFTRVRRALEAGRAALGAS